MKIPGPRGDGVRGRVGRHAERWRGTRHAGEAGTPGRPRRSLDRRPRRAVEGRGRVAVGGGPSYPHAERRPGKRHPPLDTRFLRAGFPWPLGRHSTVTAARTVYASIRRRGVASTYRVQVAVQVTVATTSATCMQRARSPRIADERRRCKAEAQVLIVCVFDATRPLLSVCRTVKESSKASGRPSRSAATNASSSRLADDSPGDPMHPPTPRGTKRPVRPPPINELPPPPPRPT